MQPDQIKKFEVFVTPLYDGNLNNALYDPFNSPDLDQIGDIVDQLFDGLKQLKHANACHNDIKPANILYRLVGNKYEIGARFHVEHYYFRHEKGKMIFNHQKVDNKLIIKY